MHILSETIHDHTMMILKSLHSDIERIITLYTANKIYYDRIDLKRLWNSPLSYVEKAIKDQKEKTYEASDELREASNSYEMTPFNGMSENEIWVLEKRVDRLTAEYKEQKTKLDNLYKERSMIEKEKFSVPSDIFKMIYTKCFDIIFIVEKYYQKPVDKKEEQSVNTEIYLSMAILGPIHKLCSGIQFESISDIDFFHALNMHQASKPLEVCKNEKIRVCYLINQLSEKIEKEKRNEWIGAMLQICGIEQDYYRSKYREPISDLPSKKNKEFAEALKEIIG